MVCGAPSVSPEGLAPDRPFSRRDHGTSRRVFGWRFRVEPTSRAPRIRGSPRNRHVRPRTRELRVTHPRPGRRVRQGQDSGRRRHPVRHGKPHVWVRRQIGDCIAENNSTRTVSAQSLRFQTLQATPTTCTSNACDPYCNQWAENPSGSFDAGVDSGFKIVDGGLTVNATGTFNLSSCTGITVTPVTEVDDTHAEYADADGGPTRSSSPLRSRRLAAIRAPRPSSFGTIDDSRSDALTMTKHGATSARSSRSRRSRAASRSSRTSARSTAEASRSSSTSTCSTRAPTPRTRRPSR